MNIYLFFWKRCLFGFHIPKFEDVCHIKPQYIQHIVVA